MNEINLVLTSAVVSALVAGGFSLWGQHLERKKRQLENELARRARLDELLLAKAVEMVQDEKKAYLEIIKTTKASGIVPPDILSVAQIMRYLRHLVENKALPEDLKISLRSQLEQAKIANPKSADFFDEMLTSEDLKALSTLPAMQQGKSPQPPTS